MSNVLPLTIRPGALPPNAKYTPQQFLDVLATALQIESQAEFALFVSGAIEPVYNAGPFLLNGITWRVWRDGLGAYSPLVLEQESLKYALSTDAPDQTKYDFWIKLDGAGKGQGIFKYYNGAWTDVYADVFYSKAEVDTKVASAIPIGTILPYGGGSAPTGYLICNNQAVSRVTYAPLFGVIGTTYGAGDLLTTFNVPDLRGRTPVGVGTGDADWGQTWTLGNKRGAEQHILSVSELAAHSHTATLGLGNADGNDNLNNEGVLFSTVGPAGAYNNVSSNNGGGFSHNNVQPSLGVNFIIKF
jgi:microcystin-dependent protein